MRVWLVAAALLLTAPLGVANRAYAAQLVQSVEDDESTCQFCGFSVGFDQFNPALGQLTDITIAVSGVDNFLAQFSIDPACDMDICDWTIDFGLSVGFTINGPGLPFADPFYSSDFFDIANWQGEASTSDLSDQSASVAISYETTPFDFSEYIGTGNIGLNFGESEDSDFCTFTAINCFLYSSADITTKLTYTYTPAPEAPTAPLMAAGMAAIGAMGWARRRQANI